MFKNSFYLQIAMQNLIVQPMNLLLLLLLLWNDKSEESNVLIILKYKFKRIYKPKISYIENGQTL